LKTVVGAFLNFRGAWAAMEPAMHREPHNKPPVHPVLYLKPANTWRAPGQPIVLPPDVDEIEVGATLGVVIGRTAARVREADALSHVAGYVVVNDVTVPHSSALRPPIRQKCRDSFCPIGPVISAASVGDPHALAIRAYVNGELRLENTTAHLVRRVPRLIAEVTEFMSLATGDVLLVGLPENLPRARAGDRVCVEIERVGRLENPVEREGGAA
jgi:5-oxopent-3-ene-1,2,5-tricarboxylate decarboxylase/2-hydroxyhepta-2,4-diene-1,7-dioate isomerase